MRWILTVALASLALVPDPDASAAPAKVWVEGTHYVLLNPVQRTSVPAGKIEVMEVFSYGCIACNRFQPVIASLESGLPQNAQMVFLAAAFNPGENWPMLQRAYLTARSLGIAERTHQAMFDAVWKSGELGLLDPATRQPRRSPPSIEDAARFYARLTGVDAASFVSTAKSFVIDMQMSAADAQIEAMQVPGTPCLVVNGKYRVINDSVTSADELIELVNYLVMRETR
jgi:thiol:disulfide interchange protein DsbA